METIAEIYFWRNGTHNIDLLPLKHFNGPKTLMPGERAHSVHLGLLLPSGQPGTEKERKHLCSDCGLFILRAHISTNATIYILIMFFFLYFLPLLLLKKSNVVPKLIFHHHFKKENKVNRHHYHHNHRDELGINIIHIYLISSVYFFILTSHYWPTFLFLTVTVRDGENRGEGDGDMWPKDHEPLPSQTHMSEPPHGAISRLWRPHALCISCKRMTVISLFFYMWEEVRGVRSEAGLKSWDP